MKSQYMFIIVKDFKINQKTSSICNIELNRKSENEDRSDSCTQDCKCYLCTLDLPNAERKRALWERNNQHLWTKLCVLRQLLVLSTKLLVNKIARVASVLLMVYVFTYKAYERCILIMLNFLSFKSVNLRGALRIWAKHPTT